MIDRFLPCMERREPRAHGAPLAGAQLRSTPEDFQVDEVLGFQADGAGPHVLLQVRKRNANTDWVATQLAGFAGVGAGEVGYAGLKDRLAVTTQWFSVNLQGRQTPDWSAFDTDDVQILTVAPHSRKLRRGALAGNHFCLTLRAVDGDKTALEQRLETIRQRGVPNYFGDQRFGRGDGNLRRAAEMFARGNARRVPRHKRSLYLSAARSLLFNRLLGVRVAEGSWDRPRGGDVMMLAGSHSIFTTEGPDEDLARRCSEGDIHPTGPMWGRGRSPAADQALELEERALAGCEAWCDALEQAGLKQERRALRLSVEELAWDWPQPDVLRLRFTLTAGAYATSVVRELVSPIEDTVSAV